MKIFGPVPSRRLGRSVGINNIRPKFCSYSCVYCQLGPTKKKEAGRQAFYEPSELADKVNEKIVATKKVGEKIDYLTFVADGEPTLDVNLGREIDLIRPFGIKVAVITNASLISRADVRSDLMKADWVSVKVDGAEESLWQKINRPEDSLEFSSIISGISDFAKTYTGDLTTETMLIRDVNDKSDEIKKVAKFLSKVEPKTAYISVPTRPPAEKWVRPATENSVNLAYQIFSEYLENVEYLIGYEGCDFTLTGDAKEDILSITSVHPIRKDAMGDFLDKAKSDWSIVERLIENGRLMEVKYRGKSFYVRSLPGGRS